MKSSFVRITHRYEDFSDNTHNPLNPTISKRHNDNTSQNSRKINMNKLQQGLSKKAPNNIFVCNPTSRSDRRWQSERATPDYVLIQISSKQYDLPDASYTCRIIDSLSKSHPEKNPLLQRTKVRFPRNFRSEIFFELRGTC